MNCKPHSIVMMVKPAQFEPCANRALGAPVSITLLAAPQSFSDLLRDATEGPCWLLKEPIRCPHGEPMCMGVMVLPDRCLRPFDPDSAPGEEEDHEGSQPDVTVEIVVEGQCA